MSWHTGDPDSCLFCNIYSSVFLYMCVYVFVTVVIVLQHVVLFLRILAVWKAISINNEVSLQFSFVNKKYTYCTWAHSGQ